MIKRWITFFAWSLFYGIQPFQSSKVCFRTTISDFSSQAKKSVPALKLSYEPNPNLV